MFFNIQRSFLSVAYSLLLVLASFSTTQNIAVAADLQLPDLGGAGAGLITPRQEYELGQNWLRMYRAQVPTSTDPFLQTYVERLIQGLSTYSDLKDKRLDVLVIENPTLNAFAVPGGIVGVHTGLFSYANNEDQFSSVLAHELAHLSQRHFARRLADQKEKSVPTMAALLASILLAATAGADAGIAAISVTQAASIDSQLRFSRGMEQEADRIGMETMVNAGKDPFAMPAMFEGMLRASRYSARPPEFLLTHPLTESRVSDAQLRAQQYNQRYFAQSSEFQLAKIRASLIHQKNISAAIREFQDELKGSRYSPEAASYGLTLALTRANKFNEAEQALAPLLKNAPNNMYFVVAQADIDSQRGKLDLAKKRLTTKLLDYPNHHALNVRLAEILMQDGDYKACEELLIKHSGRRPKDDYVWYLLAEVHGLAGNIFEVHTARAEYFMLNGLFDKAIIQLKNAKLLIKDDRYATSKIDERLKEARNQREQSRL